MYYITQYQSPLGKILLASDGENIIGLWLEGQKYFGDSVEGEKTQKDELLVFIAARNGWTGTLQEKTLQLRNCHWRHGEVHLDRRYGKFFVKFHMGS